MDSAAIEAFLARKWARDLDYRLIKEPWAFRENLPPAQTLSWAALLRGLRPSGSKTVLRAISLDLFAVLFGGATAGVGVGVCHCDWRRRHNSYCLRGTRFFPGLRRMQTFEH